MPRSLSATVSKQSEAPAAAADVGRHQTYLRRPAPAAPLADRSLTKYRLIVEEAGGWAALQAVLAATQAVAGSRRTTIAGVAQRFVLDRPSVAAVIVGTRHAGHLEENLRMLDLKLVEDDRRRLVAVLAAADGPAGDVYHLERDRRGRHWAILRTGLHRGEQGGARCGGE